MKNGPLLKTIAGPYFRKLNFNKKIFKNYNSALNALFIMHTSLVYSVDERTITIGSTSKDLLRVLDFSGAYQVKKRFT